MKNRTQQLTANHRLIGDASLITVSTIKKTFVAQMPSAANVDFFKKRVDVIGRTGEYVICRIDGVISKTLISDYSWVLQSQKKNPKQLIAKIPQLFVS